MRGWRYGKDDVYFVCVVDIIYRLFIVINKGTIIMLFYWGDGPYFYRLFFWNFGELL